MGRADLGLGSSSSSSPRLRGGHALRSMDRASRPHAERVDRRRRHRRGQGRRATPTYCRPDLTVDEAASRGRRPRSHGAARCVVIGLFVLVPSLTWLFRLTLRGQLTGSELIRTLVLFVRRSVGVLFFFDSTITITAGIMILLASIVSGVFATATPEFMKARTRGRQLARSRPSQATSAAGGAHPLAPQAARTRRPVASTALAATMYVPSGARCRARSVEIHKPPCA